MKGVILLEIDEFLVCPECNNKNFTIRREATYVYSYKFNSEEIKKANSRVDELPFLFDNRENTKSSEFVECDNCGLKFPISLEKCNQKINLTILQKAIRSDFVEKPEFFG